MWSDTRMNGSYESDIFLMNQKHTVQPVWSNSWTNDYYEWIGLSKSKLYCENNVVWFLNKLFLWTVLFTESESYSKTSVVWFPNKLFFLVWFFLVNQKHTVQPV